MYKLLYWIFRHMVLPSVTLIYDKVYDWYSIVLRNATKDEMPF